MLVHAIMPTGLVTAQEDRYGPVGRNQDDELTVRGEFRGRGRQSAHWNGDLA